MKLEEVIEKMTPIFQDILDIDDLILTPELSADEIEEWDSLSHIRLIVAHEVEFKVKFTTNEVNELDNVGQLAELIISKA
ncbi:Acyl carrier protein [Candidatus Terasakiella magnetica]|uniref:Acyl carrier protein n=1 Tax=Candidatus Terasakiella magnetica TaxID=1867952 RepID=A0A1C3RGA3_9PROT|nr:acyl carrier protein [Candidatus Terasakiella magnetica]SCA56281.1 Acyl carrier protein [Candidatus Terasakiella magnetica]